MMMFDFYFLELDFKQHIATGRLFAARNQCKSTR